MDLKHSYSVKLNDGNLMPVLGFGTFASEEVPKSKAFEATKVAIDVGFRHIDAAYFYQNEEEVGQALRDKITDGTVKREDLFYTTKPGEELLPNDASGKIILETVDIRDTWEVECHPYLNQSKLLEFCKSKDIVLVAYSALGSHRDPNWIDSDSPYLLEEPILKTIAKKHNRTPGQVALRYLLQRGVVVLAKSFNEKRIKENFQVPKDKLIKAIKIAIDAGFRHFDSAYSYQIEEEVGQAIRSKIADGTVKRKDIFYTSKSFVTPKAKQLKYYPTYLRRLHGPDSEGFGSLIKRGKVTSVKSLKFVILFQPGDEIIPKDEHGNVLIDPVDLCDTWEAMEKCKDAGLAKSIGVSNFNRRQLEMILNKPGLKYKPVCNQVECHVYLNQSKMLDYCKSKDIALVAYCTLGSSRDPLWVDQNSPVLLDDPVICAMAKKYKQTSALVALRYLLQRGIVVLARSFNEKRIKEFMQTQAAAKLHVWVCGPVATGVCDDVHDLCYHVLLLQAAICAAAAPSLTASHVHVPAALSCDQHRLAFSVPAIIVSVACTHLRPRIKSHSLSSYICQAWSPPFEGFPIPSKNTSPIRS
ncbi:aldo-keto reductase family 1 member C14 [Cricetulus griseus]